MNAHNTPFANGSAGNRQWVRLSLTAQMRWPTASLNRQARELALRQLRRSRRVLRAIEDDRQRAAALMQEGDRIDDILRLYSIGGSVPQSLQAALKQEILAWKSQDFMAAETFEEHLRCCAAAARTPVRMFAMASWFAELSPGMANMLRRVLEYYHGEAVLKVDLRRSEQNAHSSASLLPDEYAEYEHAAERTQIAVITAEPDNRVVSIIVQAFLPFGHSHGLDNDIDAIAEFSLQCDKLDVPVRQLLRRVFGGLHARKALLHPSHPRHMATTFADSVQARVMRWCEQAYSTLRSMDNNASIILSDEDQSLLTSTKGAVKLFARSTTYNDINTVQSSVPQYIHRHDAYITGQDASLSNQMWLEVKADEFEEFEDNYGPVLGTEWRRRAGVR